MHLLAFFLRPRCLAFACLFSTAGSSSLQAADWPMLRGPEGTGISREEKLPAVGAAEELWSVEVGLGYSAPVIQDGQILVSGHDGDETDTLYCLDAGSGRTIWTHSYPQPLGDLYFQGGTTGTSTWDGDRVYHVARQGELFCLDASSGNVIWTLHLQDDFGYSKPTWGFTGAPLVRGDRLYVTAGESGLALRKSDGGVIWKSDDEECGYSTPVPLTRGEDRYLIFSNKRFYVCVDSETGERVWRHRWMTRYGVNAADPIVTDEHIFISSGYGKGAVLLRWDGSGDPERVWQSRDLRTQMNAAVLIDGYLYGIDGNERVDGTGLKCLDFLTGEVRWTETGVGHGTVSAVRDQLVVLSEEGTLLLAEASPNGFEPDFSQRVLGPKVWTVPVVSDGVIYCRNAAGSLVAVRPGAGS